MGMNIFDKVFLSYMGIMILAIVISGYFIFVAPYIEEECLAKIAGEYCQKQGVCISKCFCFY